MKCSNVLLSIVFHLRRPPFAALNRKFFCPISRKLSYISRKLSYISRATLVRALTRVEPRQPWSARSHSSAPYGLLDPVPQLLRSDFAPSRTKPSVRTTSAFCSNTPRQNMSAVFRNPEYPSIPKTWTDSTSALSTGQRQPRGLIALRKLLEAPATDPNRPNLDLLLCL